MYNSSLLFHSISHSIVYYVVIIILNFELSAKMAGNITESWLALAHVIMAIMRRR